MAGSAGHDDHHPSVRAAGLRRRAGKSNLEHANAVRTETARTASFVSVGSRREPQPMCREVAVSNVVMVGA